MTGHGSTYVGTAYDCKFVLKTALTSSRSRRKRLSIPTMVSSSELSGWPFFSSHDVHSFMSGTTYDTSVGSSSLSLLTRVTFSLIKGC